MAGVIETDENTLVAIVHKTLCVYLIDRKLKQAIKKVNNHTAEDFPLNIKFIG